jgi:hypothetical protein
MPTLPGMNSSRRINGWLLASVIGYVALLSLVVGSMFWVRHTALTQLSAPQSIADWESWREDVRREETIPGPVQRRVPKSDEPPALVLMRDYFVVSFVGAVFFTSILYWIMAWFVTGALGRN